MTGVESARCVLPWPHLAADGPYCAWSATARTRKSWNKQEGPCSTRERVSSHSPSRGKPRADAPMKLPASAPGRVSIVDDSVQMLDVGMDAIKRVADHRDHLAS
jgi:hypothetical protein